MGVSCQAGGAEAIVYEKKPRSAEETAGGWTVASWLPNTVDRGSLEEGGGEEKGLGDPGVSPEASEQFVKDPLFGEVGC